MTQPAEPEAVRAVSERLKANSGDSGQAEPLPPSCFPLVITHTLEAITKVETLNPGTFAGVSWPFCRGVLAPLPGGLAGAVFGPLGHPGELGRTSSLSCLACPRGVSRGTRPLACQVDLGSQRPARLIGALGFPQHSGVLSPPTTAR